MRNSRSVEQFFLDIFTAIGKIEQYTADFDNGEELQCNSLHWDATIRQLEIIGEALNNILKDQEIELHAPKYFRKVVNIRNAISHGYFGIHVFEVWNVATTKLADLSSDLFKLSNQMNIDLRHATDLVIEELASLKDFKTIDFLKKSFNID